MVELSMDGIGDALDKGLTTAQPFLFGLGFVFGATEGQVTANPTEASNIAWRIKDALSNLGIGGITVAPGFTSVSAFKFKPLGFVNKGLAAAIAVWLYKEAHLPYHKEIFKGVFPFAVGYSIGGEFDPSPGYQPVTGPIGGMSFALPNQPFARAGMLATPMVVS